MRSIYIKIIHPPVWIYLSFTILIMASIWTYHYYDELKQTQNTPYPKSSIINIDIGLPPSNWKIIGFADLTRTRNIDIIYKDEERKQIAVYRFNKLLQKYQQVQLIQLSINVQSLTFIDLDNTGFNDLLLSHSNNNQPPYGLSIIRNSEGVLDQEPISLNISSFNFPFVFDFNQSGISDFLYTNPTTHEYSLFYNKNIKFLPLKSETLTPITFYSIGAAQLIQNDTINIIGVTEQNQHYSVISVFSFRSKEHSWKCVQEFQAPPNIGPIAIGDFDGDSHLDIVFPVYPLKLNKKESENQESETNKITSIIRSYLPNFSMSNHIARHFLDSSYLCFMFNGEDGFYSDLNCSNKTSSIQFSIDNIAANAQPLVGDLTLSGSPDILLTLDEGPTKQSTQLILNQQCKTCATREMMLVTHSTYTGVGGFFDFFQNGKLDILTNEGAFLSTLAEDSYFLRATPLNGLCLDGCKKIKGKNKQRYPNPPPLSTVYNGATMKAVYTDKAGNKHQLVGSSRSTNGLTLPYYTFGLGENVHYVEELDVQTNNNDQLTWILPSSDVYSSANHQYRVFLMYQVHGFYVFYGFLALFFSLQMFVLIFSRKEDEEDKKEAEQILPLF